MKSKNTKKITTVKELKNYLEKFDDLDQLSDICIKHMLPTKFRVEFNCVLTLNTDDIDDAESLAASELKKVFGQKIEDINVVDVELE